jgi:hypothetical protein
MISLQKIKIVQKMNFNKLYAFLCGLSTLPIFTTYFYVYYKKLEHFTSEIQKGIILISSIAFLASLIVLVKKYKLLFSKEYIYTSIILILISLLAMWYNYFLYCRI